MPRNDDPWWTFHRDWYLDLRRPEWRDHERLGHVRYRLVDGDKVVVVHMDFASRVISVLAGIPAFCTYMSKFRQAVIRRQRATSETNSGDSQHKEG
jgi:hypothetical protein